MQTRDPGVFDARSRTAALGLSDPIAGLVVSVLILAPEGLAAIAAARHDNLQRAVDICLGPALATIGLTIPVVLVISFMAGQTLTLGLDPGTCLA